MPTSPSDAATAKGGALAAVDRFVSRIEDAFNLLAGVAIFALMFLTMAEVLGRRLLNAPIPGAIDIIEVGMVTFAFLGAAFCQRDGTHVRMDIVVSNLYGRVKWIVEAIAIAISLFYICVIISKSFNHFLRAYEIGDSTIDTQIPVWPSKLVVPIALSLLAARLLIQLWGYVRLVIHPEAPPMAIPQTKHVAEHAQDEIEGVMHRMHDVRPPDEPEPGAPSNER